MTSAQIDGFKERVADLCRRFHVTRLDVFGSSITDAYDPVRSDVDVLVEFGHVREGEYADTWFGLRAALEALFERPVDLITDSAVRNPYFRAELERTRRSLYAA